MLYRFSGPCPRHFLPSPRHPSGRKSTGPDDLFFLLPSGKSLLRGNLLLLRRGALILLYTSFDGRRPSYECPLLKGSAV